MAKPLDSHSGSPRKKTGRPDKTDRQTDRQTQTQTHTPNANIKTILRTEWDTTLIADGGNRSGRFLLSKTNTNR